MTVCKLRQEKGVKWHVRVVLCSTELKILNIDRLLEKILP